MLPYFYSLHMLIDQEIERAFRVGGMYFFHNQMRLSNLVAELADEENR